jgi:mono/diheme cytochrome c family protein
MSTTSNNPSSGGPLAELRLRKPPFFLIAIILVVSTATLLPFAFAFRARVHTSPYPRIHLVQDMGKQPKYGPQKPSTVFADGRADRPVIDGTVSRTAVLDDDHYSSGFTKDASGKVTFFEGYPARLTVDARFIERGQQRFAIYCSSCHGMDGNGLGIVHQRAGEIGETKWVPPTNLATDAIRIRPEGHIFNTINVGIRNMAGLGGQIPVEDRWAIVAYVRALQLAQGAPAKLLTEEQRRMAK